MKRALKVSLLVFGGIAGVMGLVAWDASARAARAVEAHEAQLAADLTALRSRPTVRSLAESIPLPTGFRTPPLHVTPGNRPMTYEAMHSGQGTMQSLYLTSMEELRRQSWMESTPRQVIERLALSQESLREGGYMAYELRRLDEERMLAEWKDVLSKRILPAEEFRQIARMLDQMWSARPGAREVLIGESVLDRLEVLNWMRRGHVPSWCLIVEPGWREMYSRTLLAAKALNELQDLERLVLALEALPLLEREPKAIEAGQKYLHGDRFTRSQLTARAGALFQGERLLLTEWNLARGATAIVRFFNDKHRDPAADLKELVPEYLAEVPFNVYTGEPFLWKDGVLQTRPGGQGPHSRWPIVRP